MTDTPHAMNPDEIESAIAAFMQSSAMQRVCDMAASSPWDASDPSQIREGLATVALQMVEIDAAERVGFANENDRILFYGLLALAFEAALDGQFAAGLSPAVLQG